MGASASRAQNRPTVIRPRVRMSIRSIEIRAGRQGQFTQGRAHDSHTWRGGVLSVRRANGIDLRACVAVCIRYMHSTYFNAITIRS